jgi:hypothetical protein
MWKNQAAQRCMQYMYCRLLQQGFYFKLVATQAVRTAWLFIDCICRLTQTESDAAVSLITSF